MAGKDPTRLVVVKRARGKQPLATGSASKKRATNYAIDYAELVLFFCVQRMTHTRKGRINALRGLSITWTVALLHYNKILHANTKAVSVTHRRCTAAGHPLDRRPAGQAKFLHTSACS